MAKNYIKNSDGSYKKNANGERLFWSDSDGDSRPDTHQTVYREHKGVAGGDSKTNSTYNPSKKKFNK